MRRLVLALVAGVLAVPAAAQDPIMALDPTLMAGWSGQAAALEQMKRGAGTQIARRRPSARLAVSPARAVARFAFRPDAAVRNRVHVRAIAQARRIDPKGAGQLQALLTSPGFRSKASAYVARYGMSLDNLADATALYLASAWFASRGDNGDPSPAQMAGLRRQVAAAMAATPGLATASNATKQEIAEANIVQALLASALAETAARNPKGAAPYRVAAVQSVKASYRLDLSRMTLTAQGLR